MTPEEWAAGVDVRYWYRLHADLCPNCGWVLKDLWVGANLVPHWTGECKSLREAEYLKEIEGNIMATVPIKVEASFGRYGVTFYCDSCGQHLKELPSKNLAHPTLRGVFRKDRIDCVFAGKMFKNPFRQITLEPID